MDVKEYISSGIIESYTLGVVSDQERQEVECMSKIYPEIMEELTAAQDQLQSIASTWAVEPPTGLKDKVIAAIAITEQLKEKKEDSKPEAKVISMKTESQEQSDNDSGNWKMIAAVAVVALLAVGTMYFSTRSDMSELSTEYNELSASIEAKNSVLSNFEGALAEYESEKAFLMHSATSKIQLTGTGVSPSAKMNIYWNTQVKKMIMAGMDLPEPSKELQYQLWAIVDGTPVDLGVFDIEGENAILKREADIENVQAFAVTLETKGGNPTPNLEQLYVIGNV